MTRAELVELLEVERFTPPPRRPRMVAEPPEPITPEQAAHNRQVLLDALSDDPVVVAWRERQAS